MDSWNKPKIKKKEKITNEREREVLRSEQEIGGNNRTQLTIRRGRRADMKEKS